MAVGLIADRNRSIQEKQNEQQRLVNEINQIMRLISRLEDQMALLPKTSPEYLQKATIVRELHGEQVQLTHTVNRLGADINEIRREIDDWINSFPHAGNQ